MKTILIANEDYVMQLKGPEKVGKWTLSYECLLPTKSRMNFDVTNFHSPELQP